MGLSLFKKNKTRVFLDTNILLLIGSKGIDVFTQIPLLIIEVVELVVVDATLKELQDIIDGKTKAKGKEKFHAKLGFILVKQKGLKVVKSSSSYADDGIVDNLKAGDYVATLDKELQQRVRSKGGKIITVRQQRLVVQEK